MILRWNLWLWLAWAAIWFAAAWFVKRTKNSESFLARLQHTVPTFLGFALVFGNFSPSLYESPEIRWAGTALTAAGLAFAVWARVHLGRNWSAMITLKEGHRLIRTGPYRFARHPIYTGFLAGVLGSAVTAGTAAAFAGFALISAAYWIKLRREEKLLLGVFGAEYEVFRREVRALVPFLL